MTPQESAQIDALIQDVTQKVVGSLDTILIEAVQKEVSTVLSQSLSRALKDGAFFRKVNDDMREGLEKIYREINEAKKEAAKDLQPAETNELISQASDQLDAILQSTEDAAVAIMDIVEEHQKRVINVGEVLQQLRTGGASKENVDRLIELNARNQSDLMEIMTALSFQDLTGQRIKKIINALQRIEEIVFNVYMSTGLKVRARDQEPERDETEIEKETEQKMEALEKGKTVKGSKLEGPANATNQEDVDDLLAQLGLE